MKWLKVEFDIQAFQNGVYDIKIKDLFKSQNVLVQDWQNSNYTYLKVRTHFLNLQKDVIVM